MSTRRIGDTKHLPIETRIRYAETRIAEAKYIGWKKLEDSWQETLDQLHIIKPKKEIVVQPVAYDPPRPCHRHRPW